MHLNSLKPAKGAKTVGKRVGRGIGCGKGKTCGRGHKGQRARAGGFHKVGFEGGQMPLQRRLPKFGFKSRKGFVTAEVRLTDLNKLTSDVVSIETLRAANIINSAIKFVKIINTGELTSTNKFVIHTNIRITKNALAVIEAAGGKIGA